MTYKVCTSCNSEKLLSEFRRDKSQRSGYQPRCKVCARRAASVMYSDNYATRARARTADNFERIKSVIDNHKRDNPCLLCGEDNIYCLAFHHKDPNEKDFGIGGAGNRSVQRVIDEIAKCVVLCHNCHSKVHAGYITLL